jgi:hypothetical protein
MIRIFTGLALLAMSATSAPLHAGSFDCSVVFDEFDSLMNKEFLVRPGDYTRSIEGKISRDDFNSEQKGKLLLTPNRDGMGVAIIQTNAGKWGKFLFTWGGRGDARGNPLLILRDVTLFGDVESGDRPRITREIRLSTGGKVDIDTGLAGEGVEPDIWFHDVDGKTMLIEAVNGASLSFPVETLCR